MIVAALSYGCAANPADTRRRRPSQRGAESFTEAGRNETLAITPENSKVEFVASKVTRSHNGSFKQFSGAIDLAPDNIPTSRVTIDIDTASVATDTDRLTAHLQKPDFFDVAKFPKGTFVSTKIEPGIKASTNYEVTGNFDLHGVKKSITFPAMITVTADSVSVTAEFAINRKDFGIVYQNIGDDLIRDEVVIKLTLKVPRKK